jgi:hypothetical protein
VLRIELVMALSAGVGGGLAGLLWSRLVSAPWLARLAPPADSAWENESATSMVAGAALHAAGGAALGFLFWLGWGLISLVNVPWLAAGLLFGLLVWTGAAVPLLGGLALRFRSYRTVALVLAVEWLVTSLAIGLACALSWQRNT